MWHEPLFAAFALDCPACSLPMVPTSQTVSEESRRCLSPQRLSSRLSSHHRRFFFFWYSSSRTLCPDLHRPDFQWLRGHVPDLHLSHSKCLHGCVRFQTISCCLFLICALKVFVWLGMPSLARRLAKLYLPVLLSAALFCFVLRKFLLLLLFCLFSLHSLPPMTSCWSLRASGSSFWL